MADQSEANLVPKDTQSSSSDILEQKFISTVHEATAKLPVFVDALQSHRPAGNVPLLIENPSEQPKRFQILSLDGGGMKGLFAAALLANFQERLDRPIIDYFDLLAGTSTGGIIAIGLGLGLSPRELVQFYATKGQSIFRHGVTTKLRHYAKTKFCNIELESALQDRSAFGDKRLSDSKKRLLITAYNLGQDDVRVFKTAHSSDETRDSALPAWKIARATTAAPTYFPCCQHIHAQRLIDGGVWANNPAMLAVTEAYSLGYNLESQRILSIGTFDDVEDRPKSLNGGGMFAWRNSAVSVLMRGQSEGVHLQIEQLLGTDRTLRINPKVPAKQFQLDKLNTDEMLAWANHVCAKHESVVKRRFCNDYLAPDFTPISTK